MPHDTSHLRIVRTRRAYNRWAADQTFEDYALRFTARSARTATPMRAAFTALGSISFLALEAIGGTLTLAFGFTNTAIAITFVTVLIFCITLPLCATAAKAGLDVDLLTRGTGFGYIGSTVTSLIYASFTFIFFGLEAAILAGTLHILLNIPLWLAYLACAVVIIPLVARGITFIAKFQIITFPIWFFLNLLPLSILIIQHPLWLAEWTHFSGLVQHTSGIDTLAIGSAASVMIVLVCQSAEQIDFLRFLPPLTAQNKRQWWSALILGGPAWIVLDAAKLASCRIISWMGCFTCRFFTFTGHTTWFDVSFGMEQFYAPRACYSPYDRFGGCVSNQNQYYKCVCRISRLVELFLPTYTFSSWAGLLRSF